MANAVSRVSGPRETSSILAGFAILFMTVGFFWLPRVGLMPFNAEHWTADLRTALLAPRATPSDDVVVVGISESTLADYPYVSPIDRGMLAELIGVLDEFDPAAIGVDLIFDRATEPAKDAALLAALKRAKAPVVMVRLDASELSAPGFAYQEQFLNAASAALGHPHFRFQVARFAVDERTVRTIPGAEAGVPAWSEALVDAVAGSAMRRASSHGSWSHRFGPQQTTDGPTLTQPIASARNLLDTLQARVRDNLFRPSNQIAWQRPPEDGADQFRQLPAQSILTIARLPAAIAGPAKAAIGAGITGRLVMIGGTFADRDRHPTPLSVVSRQETSGVLVHATIVTQLLEGRSVLEPTDGLDLLLIALVAGTAVWLGWRHALKRYEFVIALVGALILIAADFGIYAAFGSVLPLNTHWQIWVLGLTVGSWIAGREELCELRLQAQ